MISIPSKLNLWFHLGWKIVFLWLYLLVKLAHEGFIKCFLKYFNSSLKGKSDLNLSWCSIICTNTFWICSNSSMKWLNRRGHRSWLLWRKTAQCLWLEYIWGICWNILVGSRLHVVLSVGQRSLEPKFKCCLKQSQPKNNVVKFLANLFPISASCLHSTTTQSKRVSNVFSCNS